MEVPREWRRVPNPKSFVRVLIPISSLVSRSTAWSGVSPWSTCPATEPFQ